MSVSSVTLSSLATSAAAAPPTAEGLSADRSADDRRVQPAPTTTPSQDERQPVKAAVSRGVGQAIDISA